MPEKIQQNQEKIPANSEVFLNKLLAGEHIPEDSKVAIVMSHPDDEAIAVGAQIKHFPGCLMVHVTDGAPSDPKEWQKRGFASQEEYARARKGELDNALNIAGHTGPRQLLNVKDQRVAFTLAENVRQLAAVFEKKHIRFVITHAYEGGHPDHDAVAFSVHAAKKILEKKGLKLYIIETPLYRFENSKNIRQSFIPNPHTKVFAIPLTDEQRRIKSELYTSHGSQQGVLNQMSSDMEWFRESPDYDFAQPASGEDLSYLFTNAGIDNSTWTKLVDDALIELGLEKSL